MRFPLRVCLQFSAGLILFSQILPAATIAFEGLSDSTVLTSQYPGLIFQNAIVLSAGISLNEFEFPPHSGTNVASDNGGPLSIVFSSPIASFSAYFTYLSPLTATAYSSTSSIVATAHSLFSDNLACLAGPPCSGDPGSNPNELIQVSSAAGISSLTISGDLAGGSFVMDDLTTTALPVSGVPEPGTVFLTLSGVATVAAFQKKRSI